MTIEIKSSAINDDSLDIKDIIEEILQQKPYFDKIIVLSNTTTNNLKFPKSSYSTTTSTNVYNYINSRFNKKDSFLEIIPLEEVNLLPILQNKLTLYTSFSNRLVFHLNQSTFQNLPSLKSNGIKVQKFKHNSIGHGSNNHISYQYKITIDFESPETEYILKVVFPHVAFIKDYHYNDVECSPTKNLANLPDLDNLENLMFRGEPEEILDMYEELTLAINGDLNLPKSITRYTLENVYSKFWSLNFTDWEVISFQRSDIHVLYIVHDERYYILKITK
ncbi:hypothetical protein KGF54_005553 [Candida jiufengensis]|uniref:uncharacterized protein n=1 Tax=Candida jiufengensis TaxID=497108 RepID=UPI002225573E|nr:uncharacterized protein KGF54_005553 [Candida jiufengensis]KAI5949318.1 hypothetical protein KGF54_005553 [Candida jiufengensis]